MKVVRDGKEYVVAEGHDWFWPGFADKTWEPSTFRIFDKFLDAERSFVDIGAWIGPTTLYAAPRAKHVFAFEPDTVAYRSLVQNVELNGAKNVIPYPVAVSDRWKGIRFGARTQFGDSMSSEIWDKGGDVHVATVSLDAIVMDINPAFIKIDIEGGEKGIFSESNFTLGEFKPTIHLSLHTPWFKDDLEEFKNAIMTGLKMYPYFYDENLQPIKLEDAFDPNSFNAIVASFKEI